MQSQLKAPEKRENSLFRLPLFFQLPEWVSMSLVVVFVLQFTIIIIISLILPLIFRYIFINNENNYEKTLEFTYDSCKAGNDYHGTICSFLSSNISLNEDGFDLKENLPYSISLNLVLADSPKNRKISSFITSIFLLTNTKSDSIVRLKKVVNLRWSWFKSTLIWWRNFFFYPLYLFGIFDDNIISVDMLFTNKFIPNNTKLMVKNLLVQIESRQVEVNTARIFIIPYRTLLQNLLFEFPIATYCVLLFIFFALLLVLFFFIWIKKINNHRNNFYESKSDIQINANLLCEANDDSTINKLKLTNKSLKSISISKDIKIPNPPNCIMHKYFNLDLIPGWNTNDNNQLKKDEENVLRKREICKDKL
uniref:Seipin n=1 Tax=Strongyloides stercoralis TaxID=6248 RepID=A0A0K0ETH4_STRER